MDPPQISDSATGVCERCKVTSEAPVITSPAAPFYMSEKPSPKLATCYKLESLWSTFGSTTPSGPSKACLLKLALYWFRTDRLFTYTSWQNSSALSLLLMARLHQPHAALLLSKPTHQPRTNSIQIPSRCKPASLHWHHVCWHQGAQMFPIISRYYPLTWKPLPCSTTPHWAGAFILTLT